MTRKAKDEKVRTFTAHPVQGAIGFPGFVGVATKEPFKGVFLAGLVRDPMIGRGVWRSKPILMRRYLCTWERVSVVKVVPESKVPGKTHSTLDQGEVQSLALAWEAVAVAVAGFRKT
jgi:hypothetical protein